MLPPVAPAVAPPSNSWLWSASRVLRACCARAARMPVIRILQLTRLSQIRTLIIDCLVMTNLFYPSFAMFLERRFEQPSTGPALATAPGDHQTIAKARGALAFFTTPLSETFFPPPPPLLPNVEWGPWWASEAGADAAWVPVSKAGTSSDATVQLQRVAWADVGDVLDAEHDADWTPRDDQIVSAVRALAEAWDVASPEGAGARCVRHLVDRNGEAVASGPCYFISPRSADPIAGGSMPLSDLWNDSSGSETSQKVYRGLMVPFHKPANVSAFQATWTARIAEVLAPLGAEVFTETYAGGKDVESTTLVSVSLCVVAGKGEEYPSCFPLPSLPDMVTNRAKKSLASFHRPTHPYTEKLTSFAVLEFAQTASARGRIIVAALLDPRGICNSPRRAPLPAFECVQGALAVRSRVHRRGPAVLLRRHVVQHPLAVWLERMGIKQERHYSADLCASLCRRRCRCREHVRDGECTALEAASWC